MKFKEKREREGKEIFIFESTGRLLPVFLGVVGIDEIGEICTGYDDSLQVEGRYPDSELRPSERKELADMMIARWTAYGNETS